MSRRSSRGSDVFRERDEDEQSIIDVFEFDDIAEDRWLCSTGTSSRRNSVEAKIQDIDGWLHADVQEADAAPSDSNSRRSIDTRTFTRIKRRSHNRLSFDSVESSVSPETRSSSLSNVWKNQPIPESPIQNVNNNNNKEQKERTDNIPMMLRPKTNQVLAALLSESPSSISSQTSMEAFMNMASSKEGISSLISDMSDPDVSHFLMNISQPSLLYSSLISDGRGDESVHAAAVAAFDSFVDSQILTDSMMEASMFKEAQDSTIIADFLKQNDCTVLEDETYCKSPNTLDLNDKTFVNENIGDKTYINITDKDHKSSNETFVTNSENLKTNDTFTCFSSPISEFEANSTKILSPLNSTKIVDSTSPNPLNSTRNLSFDHDMPVLLQKKDLVSTTITLDSEKKTDLTFELKAKSTSPIKERLSETFQTSNSLVKPIPRFSESTDNGNPIDSTFSAVPNLRAVLLQEVRRSSGKFDATFNAPLSHTDTKFDTTYERPNSTENKFDATYERPNSAELVINDNDEEDLDATYVQVSSAHHFESKTVNKPLNETYDSAQVNSKLSNAAGPRRISYAKKNSAESQMHLQDPNRFNTFRKDSKIGSRLSKAPQPLETNSYKPVTAVPLQPHVPNAKSNENLYQQRFNTFSKKTSLLKSHVRNEINVEENKQDSKFVKPLEKLPVRQIQAPRQLSKLPHMFQKSNPNLGSNLKASGRLTLDADANFNKGSQPNISSNSHALGRFKSERLLPIKHNVDFGSGNGTSRSMESIESTVSAHSAPDLDDRLSVCSDSSRASYTVKPRNLEVLKKLASMEEQGKFDGSTPKVKGRQILENTWVEGKDLPSPILKNGVGRSYTESTDSRSTSPTDSAEFNAKTSSPLTITPAISDQAINTIGNDYGGTEAVKENIRATENIRPTQMKVPNSVSNIGTNATKLRRPSNWAGGPNKTGNCASSGIPRPASRIPGPKFTRTNLK